MQPTTSGGDGRAECRAPPEVTIADKSANAGRQSPQARTTRVTHSRPARVTPSFAGARKRHRTIPITQSPNLPIAQSPVAQSPDEFVPLMPMTEQELTGIVPDRPRADAARLARGAAIAARPAERARRSRCASGRRWNGARHSRLDQRIDLSLEVSMIRNCPSSC